MGRRKKNSTFPQETGEQVLDTVGKRLQFIRTTLFQCSQREFAQIAGISLSTYSKNESDHLQVGASTIRKISRIVNLPIEWIINGKGDLPEDLGTASIKQQEAAQEKRINRISAKDLDTIIEIATDPAIQKLARQISNSCSISEEAAMTGLVLSKLNP